MLRRLTLIIAGLLLSAAPATAAECMGGVYRAPDGDFVVVAEAPNTAPSGRRYLFRDGRRGNTAEPGGPVACQPDSVEVRRADGRTERWPKLALTETDVAFESLATPLAGRLIEPAQPDPRRPLVVMVHGSERTPSRRTVYAYALAAQGIAVFAYDKRGTGASEGEYTQNFELLADDAAAALAAARKAAAGRVGRAGYFGGSQGGWVAPLAATRSRADFVAVGFGLVVSPIEEDREQMLADAQAAGLGPAEFSQIDRLSRATGRLLTSHFTEGFDELAAIRRDLVDQPWIAKVKGEHSIDMLRLDPADLRRVGRARFDNLEVIWDYDADAVLRRLDAPLLWVLAAEDREAPIAKSRAALSALSTAGKPIDVYVFPDTDHGMFEFVTGPDGSRRSTRITEGYLRLLGDWVKGEATGPYGRGEKLR